MRWTQYETIRNLLRSLVEVASVNDRGEAEILSMVFNSALLSIKAKDTDPLLAHIHYDTAKVLLKATLRERADESWIRERADDGHSETDD